MTLLLMIVAGVITTAVAVAIGGLMLMVVLSAINRSLQPSAERVIRIRRTKRNKRAVDLRERVAA